MNTTMDCILCIINSLIRLLISEIEINDSVLLQNDL